MSIKVFYIPFKYKGSTENLLRTAIDKVKGYDYSRILYIAPTPRKVRDGQQRFHRLTLLDDKRLTGLTGSYYIPPEMMTIKQLSKRLYSLYEDKNIISQSLLPIIISRLLDRGIGFASIIADFIHEIKLHHPGKDIETVSDELKAIFYELGIPEEVSGRAIEAIRVFKAYQELLSNHSAVDEDDVMIACPDLIKGHNYNPATLIFDGFYELTRSEEVILKALIENAKETLISIPYDNDFLDITDSYINFLKNNFQIEEVYLSTDEKEIEPSYYPYPGIEEEVEGIARYIKNYFISGKIRNLENVILTFPKLYEYSEIVARIFRRYGIPYTISVSKPVGKTRPFLDLIAMLESVLDDYPRLSFSQSLISPYFKNMPQVFRKYIPRLCLEAGIIKGKEAWLNLYKWEMGSGKWEVNDFSLLNKGLKWVFKKLASLESIKNKGTYSQYSEVIGKLLNDLDFSHEDTDLKEQTSIILKELSFMDTLVSYNSNLPPYTLHQFIDSMKHILNVTEIEIEGPGIQVMGFLETRGIEPEYLYFGGLRDGDLPSKPDIDHILPDSVRTQFGLVNLKKYLLLQRFTFYRTIESTRNFHLSYPVMEGERFFLPSPFLPWNREAKEHIHGIFSKEEELLRTCPELDSGKGRMHLSSHTKEIEGIKDKLIKNKFGEDSYIRVTDIDSYRSCPRKFFIEKVLQLEPLEIKEYEIEAILLGTIAHEIMQALISRPFATHDDLRIRAEDTLNKLLTDKPVENYWKELIKDTFLSILPEIYNLEKKLMDEGYSFMMAEVPVEGEIIKGARLKGKIDRIDKKIQDSKFKIQNSTLNQVQGKIQNSDEVELIDYKTGTTQFSGPQVIKKGATLQLFLYAALMKTLGFKVERVGIYSLKDIDLSWIPGKNDKKNGRTIEDYIEVSLKFLEETVLRMRKGDFSASPLNEQTCRNCSERPYCPYIHKTYGKVS